MEHSAPQNEHFAASSRTTRLQRLVYSENSSQYEADSPGFAYTKGSPAVHARPRLYPIHCRATKIVHQQQEEIETVLVSSTHFRSYVYAAVRSVRCQHQLSQYSLTIQPNKIHPPPSTPSSTPSSTCRDVGVGEPVYPPPKSRVAASTLKCNS